MGMFCLVHGSTQNASGWALLVAELHKRGHQTVCINLPNDEPEAPATRYAEAIAEATPVSAEQPIVVAHSASGLYLPIVATLRPVSRVVFLAAFVPEIGKSPMEQLRQVRGCSGRTGSAKIPPRTTPWRFSSCSTTALRKSLPGR